VKGAERLDERAKILHSTVDRNDARSLPVSGAATPGLGTRRCRQGLRRLRNLTRRLDQEAPSVGASILEGLDETLTVNRLKLPRRWAVRSPAPTDQKMLGTVRRVCRNVKRWRNPAMALRAGPPPASWRQARAFVD
jgi:hypothetical protein